MKDILKEYQQREFHVFVAQSFPRLIQLKKDQDREGFYALILKILPSIKKYINIRLNAAIGKGHFSKNKYKSDDFIDQLFIEVYEHIDAVKSAEDFYAWLFIKADELLNEVIQEEEFDDFFLKNIDDYSKPEWDEMQEKFSTDGDGDLVMMEELDDISYPKNDYTLDQVFIENDEKAYIDKIDKEINETEAQKHLQMVLRKLPLQMQSVYELFSVYNFKINEIARIKAITPSEASQLMKDARNSLRLSLLNRFLPDNK